MASEKKGDLGCAWLEFSQSELSLYRQLKGIRIRKKEVPSGGVVKSWLEPFAGHQNEK